MPLNHTFAYKTALQFIQTRERSIKEVVDFLSKKGCDLTTVQCVVSCLQEDSFLDDNRFSKNRIYSRLHSKYWGVRRIKAELQVSGITQEVIEEEISKITEQDWEEACQKLSQKYIRTHKDFVNPIKLQEYLKSYGHKDYLIHKILKISGIELSEE